MNVFLPVQENLFSIKKKFLCRNCRLLKTTAGGQTCFIKIFQAVSPHMDVLLLHYCDLLHACLQSMAVSVRVFV